MHALPNRWVHIEVMCAMVEHRAEGICFQTFWSTCTCATNAKLHVCIKSDWHLSASDAMT